MIRLILIATWPLLAVWAVGLGWTVNRLLRERTRLKLRIEMLEHPERFPPQHVNCRSVVRPTYWGRDLIDNPLPAPRRPA
jgi:hypothetical protein